MLVVDLTGCGVEVPLLVSGFDLILSLNHFLGDLRLDCSFHHLSLFANFRDTIGLVSGNSILSIVCGHDLWIRLAVDADHSIVKVLASDWVFKVEVLLWNVLPRDSPTQRKEKL